MADKSPVFSEQLFKIYEDGKHRRYSLIFAVNGGAFAVAKLLGDKDPSAIGGLSMRLLATGMVLFTALMAFDISVFGWQMRQRITPGERFWKGVFGLAGQAVVIAISALIIVGWGLAGFRESTSTIDRRKTNVPHSEVPASQLMGKFPMDINYPRITQVA